MPAVWTLADESGNGFDLVSIDTSDSLGAFNVKIYDANARFFGANGQVSCDCFANDSRNRAARAMRSTLS